MIAWEAVGKGGSLSAPGKQDGTHQPLISSSPRLFLETCKLALSLAWPEFRGSLRGGGKKKKESGWYECFLFHVFLSLRRT